MKLRRIELEVDRDAGFTEEFSLHEGERIVAVTPEFSYLVVYVESPVRAAVGRDPAW